MILLDDAQSTDKAPTSRLYENPIARITACSPQEVDTALAAIEAALARGQFVVVAFSYELGEVLQGLPYRPWSTPLINAFCFERVQHLSQAEVSAWIAAQIDALDLRHQSLSSPGIAGVIETQIEHTPAQFAQEIEKIHRLIESGDTYQVNHTFRITGGVYGAPLALYARLRQRQPSRFGAFIATDEGATLSISPEWFLSCQGRTLMARPMKGTLSARNQGAHRLADDPKNRTENLMIVDLIRNDLGRISQIGTVRVPALFEVEQFGDLYQMTSTVTSEIKPGVGLRDLLLATFPCGSVTGAPKQRTMEIIQSLESTPRGLYCGAIGWFDPPTKTAMASSTSSTSSTSPVPASRPSPHHTAAGEETPLGNFAMSVAIRTLEVSRKNQFVLGVGAGITIDSESASEWRECLLKAEFLTQLPSPVGLIETIRVEGGKALRLSAHLDRLQSSAQALGLLFDRPETERRIDAVLHQEFSKPSDRSSLSPALSDAVFRLRLQLNPTGLEITLSPLPPLKGPQKIFWARDLLGHSAAQVDSTAPLFRHKTTSRELYDRAWRSAEVHGGFDALFINERGEVTEGGRSTLFVRRAGEWLTPALNCGILPSVMRKAILSDPTWQAKEAVLLPADVIEAETVILVNALRGVIAIDRHNSLRPVDTNV
jgi:para-aminobenzoate synthetase / 4-amino-4-deoxychorismate lyase